MAEKATKKTHADVGGTKVPNDMIENPGTALAVQDEKMIAEIKQLSNSVETTTKQFPTLKLQHVTTGDGEPNPLRGHFSIVRKNDLGEYETEDLGESIKFQFLLRTHFLKMQKGDDLYTSSEFEGPMEIIPLWHRTGEKSELVAEATPYDLQKRYLKKNDKGQVRSELNMLSKLYVLLNGEVVAWKLSLVGTISWSKYTKMVPFAAGVVTAVGRTEEKKGSIKYYAPVFKAEERLKDLNEVKSNIELLRDMLPKKENFGTMPEEEDVPFK